MTTFKPNKIAIGLALAGLATLPGLASATSFTLTAATTKAYPTRNGVPLVGAASSKVRVMATGVTGDTATSTVSASLVYLTSAGVEVSSGSPLAGAGDVSTASAAGFDTTISQAATLPAGAVYAVILLDAGSGNDFGVAGQQFGYIRNNNTAVTGFTTKAAAIADASTLIAGGPNKFKGVYTIDTNYSKIKATGASQDGAGTPRLFIQLNADPYVPSATVTTATQPAPWAADVLVGDATTPANADLAIFSAAQGTATTVTVTNTYDGVGGKLIQADFGAASTVTGTIALECTAGTVPQKADDGTNNGTTGNSCDQTATANHTASAAVPGYNTGNVAAATVAAGEASNMYKSTGSSAAQPKVYIRLNQALGGTVNTMSTTTVPIKTSGGSALAATYAVFDDLTSAGTIIEATLPVANGTTVVYRYDTTGATPTFNLQFSSDSGATWADLTAAVQVGAAAVNGIAQLATLPAVTTLTTVSSIKPATAETATIKTSTTDTDATDGSYLVDGAVVDFKQAVGATPAASDFLVMTDALTDPDPANAVNVALDNTGANVKSLTIGTPTATGSKVSLLLTTPSTADWTTGAAAADTAAYVQINFGSGIDDNLADNPVPFTVDDSPFAALTYTQVFDTQTGLNKTVAIAPATPITDGVQAKVMKAEMTKNNPKNTTLTDVGTLKITFSERLASDAVPLGTTNETLLNGNKDLNEAVENIAFGTSLPGTTVASSNFNLPDHVTGLIDNTVPTDRTGVLSLYDVDNGFLTQNLLIGPRISSRLDNTLLDNTANNFTDGCGSNAGTPDGLNGDCNYIASIGQEILSQTAAPLVTVSEAVVGPQPVKAKAFLTATDAGFVGSIVLTFDKALQKDTGVTDLGDFFKVTVFDTDAHNPAGNSAAGGGVVATPSGTTVAASTTVTLFLTTCSAQGLAAGQWISGAGIPADTQILACSGSNITLSQAATASALVGLTVTNAGVFKPIFDILFKDSDVALSADGKTVTLTLPTPLTHKHFGSMMVSYGENGAKTFASTASPLVSVSGALDLAAFEEDVRLPDFAVGINRLYSMDVKGSISNLPANSQIVAYLAAMPTRAEVKNPDVSVVSGNVSGGNSATCGSCEFHNVALEIDSSVNGSSCSSVSGIDYGDGPYGTALPANQFNDSVDAAAAGCSLNYRLARSLSGNGTVDAKGNAQGAVKPVQAWIAVYQTNDKAPGNAANSGLTSENRTGVSATLYGTQSAANAGIRNGSGDNRFDPLKVYEVSVDPKSGKISGPITGQLLISQNKEIAVAGLKCVRKEGFKINDPSTKSPYTACSNDNDAAWIFGLTDATGAFRFSISTDRDPSEIKDAFLLVSAKQEHLKANGAVDFSDFTLLTSADPNMSNFLPFKPDLSRTGGAMTVTDFNTVDINNIVHAPVVNTSQWQVLGVGNLAINAKATKIDIPRQFVSIQTSDGQPVTLWQGDTPDRKVNGFGVDQASDAALTLLGNKAGIATQTGGLDGNVAEKNSIAPKTNVDTKGFAVAFSDDRVVGGAGVEDQAAGGDLFFLTQAADSTKLPQGWSLITIGADTTPSALPSEITAVIRTGTPDTGDETNGVDGNGSGHAVIKETQTFFRDESENTLSTLNKGEAVFVFAEKAISGFNFQ